MALTVGLRVKALYDDAIHWYPALIANINSDGTFGVRYDDGDFRPDVRKQDIMLIDTTAADVHAVETVPSNDVELLKADLLRLQNQVRDQAVTIGRLEDQVRVGAKTLVASEAQLAEAVDAGLAAVLRADTAEEKLRTMGSSNSTTSAPGPFPVSHMSTQELGSFISENVVLKEGKVSELKLASIAVKETGEVWNFLRERCEALINCAVNNEELPIQYQIKKPSQTSTSSPPASLKKSNSFKTSSNSAASWMRPSDPSEQKTGGTLLSRRLSIGKSSSSDKSPNTSPTDQDNVLSPDTINSPLSPLDTSDTNQVPDIYNFPSPSSNRPPSSLWGVASVLGSDKFSEPKVGKKEEPKRHPSPVAERVRQWKQTAHANQAQTGRSQSASSVLTSSSNDSEENKARSSRRVSSPFIARKLASWKEGDKGSDQAEPSGAPANSWLKNQDKDKAGAAPSRRYSSPVSERVKQWRAAASRNTNSISPATTPKTDQAPSEPTASTPSETPPVTTPPVTPAAKPVPTTPSDPPDVASPKPEPKSQINAKPEGKRRESKPTPGVRPQTMGLGDGPAGNGLEEGVLFKAPDVLEVGARVYALFDDNVHYYAASVTEVQPDGSVHLRFDDGDERENVPLFDIRSKDPTAGDNDSDDSPDSLEKLQAMLTGIVPGKDQPNEKAKEKSKEKSRDKDRNKEKDKSKTKPDLSVQVEDPSADESKEKAPLSPKRMNRFAMSRSAANANPPRRASPLRGILEKDTSHAAGQAKKQLSQLEQMRNEVARIRQMNERDMPAIPEPSHEEPPSPSSSNSAVTSPCVTPDHFSEKSSQPNTPRSEVKEEQENQKPKTNPVEPTESAVAQRLRAWQGDTNRNQTSRSSSAGVAGSRAIFIGSGDRGSNSVGRMVSIDPSATNNIRTVSRSSLQVPSTSAPPRASVLSPPPRSSSRNEKEGSEDKGKLRNMSPLIAQRMAAFHKSR